MSSSHGSIGGMKMVHEFTQNIMYALIKVMRLSWLSEDEQVKELKLSRDSN